MTTELSAAQVLELIDDHVHQIRTEMKLGQDDKCLDHLNTMFHYLEHLIQSSYDYFASLDGYPEEQEELDRRVEHYHIAKARQYVNSMLLRVVSGEIVQDEALMERAARALAHLSGRGAAGAINRTWHIPYLDQNGDRQEMQIKLHEPSYIGNDIGFKTWGAAPLMARKLIQENLIPNMSSRNVLELGTGTGLVGLVCSMLGAKNVFLTDYHASVLSNVAINVELNKSNATVSRLDFIEVAKGEAAEWSNRKFDTVIASDLLYEMEHAEYLPIAVDMLTEFEFYMMIPLRDTHWDEVNTFERKMAKVGLVKRQTDDFEQEEEEGIVTYRLYQFHRPL